MPRTCPVLEAVVFYILPTFPKTGETWGTPLTVGSVTADGLGGLEFPCEGTIMQRTAMLLLLIGGVCGTALCQYSAEFSSYHLDKRYDFRITTEQLSNTPAWLEGEPGPPLSPGPAREIARENLHKFFEDADQWRVSEITLVPVAQRWVYLVGFTEPPPKNSLSHLSSPFKIVVMMDGVVVPATESSWKPQTPPQE